MTALDGTNVTNLYTFTYVWTLDGTVVYSNYNGYSYTLPSNLALGKHTLTCTVTPAYAGTDAPAAQQTASWTFDLANTANITVTVPQNIGTYNFTDSTNTQEGRSIYDQIVNALGGYYYPGTSYPGTSYPWWNGGYIDYNYTVSITQTSTGNAATLGGYAANTTLSGLSGVYLNLTGSGTWTGRYTVSYGTTTVLSGTITVKVEGAAGADIIYSARTGQSVSLNQSDFTKFWTDLYSRGSLQYVRFGSIATTTGTLTNASGVSMSGQTCYVNPSRNQYGLSGLTFRPRSTSFTGTVTIPFTATGTTAANSSLTNTVSGVVYILYTAQEPTAIAYAASTSPVTLDADDFLTNYRSTMGTAAPTSGLQIRFLDVPANGTLYVGYNTATSRGTALTAANLSSYTFSTSGLSNQSIERVTYVPGTRSGGDSVRFLCYSGGTLRYQGTVTFGLSVEDVTVKIFCPKGGVTFSQSDFYSADTSLLTASYIVFGAPSSGTLYRNWNGTTGTRVTTADRFSYVASVGGYYGISTVTYVPAAGYGGVATIPFTAYSATGATVSGTVRLSVASRDPVNFTDVPAGNWAYSYVSRLSAMGIVSGTTPTTFSPNANVKWGEALKMILLAAGYPTQTEGTGANWASNYLSLARRNGIVSSTAQIDLNAAIDRNAIAEVAAKALKLSPASRVDAGVVGPTDSTNGYVYALYNAGILNGDSSSGRNYYYGSRALERDEMAAIVCRIYDYQD